MAGRDGMAAHERTGDSPFAALRPAATATGWACFGNGLANPAVRRE
jgi:hypothetical protein